MGWWDWPAFDPAGLYDRDYFQSDAVDKGYNDYARLEPGIRRTARARLRRLTRLAPAHASTPRSLIDLGCGTGVFLDESRAAGWSARGYEVSAYGVEQARGRGLDVQRAELESLALPPAECDAVTLWDVIEHVRDPRAVIAAAASALRPGGVLAISTGDIASLCATLTRARWHLFNLPEHLYFFSRSALHTLLRNAGCEPVETVREVNWVPLAYVRERLKKSLGFAPPTLGLRDVLVPATLFDIVGVYARRAGPRQIPNQPCVR